jgi:hypothetical protein
MHDYSTWFLCFGQQKQAGSICDCVLLLWGQLINKVVCLKILKFFDIKIQRKIKNLCKYEYEIIKALIEFEIN